jgi:hypothetical protein
MMLEPQVEIVSKHEFPPLSTETITDNRAIRLGYGLGWGLDWTPYGKALQFSIPSLHRKAKNEGADRSHSRSSQGLLRKSGD